MKLFLKTYLIFGVVFAWANSANAGLLTSSVLPNQISSLQDNSVSSSFTALGAPITDPSHVIGVGDIVAGTLRIEKGTTGSSTAGGINTPSQLVVMFSAMITGAPINAGGGRYLYDLSPVAAGPMSINELLGGIGSVTNTSSQFHAGANATFFDPTTVFAILESSSAPTNSTQSFNDNLEDYRNETLGVSYSLDLTGGIVNTFGGLNAFGSTDFFQAELDKFIFGGPAGAPTLGGLGAYAATHIGAAIGSDSGAFSVVINKTALEFGSLMQSDKGYYNPPDYEAEDHTSQITFDARLLTPRSGQPALGYQFADDTTIGVNVTAIVPEPSSIILLAGGLASAFGLTLRRRNPIF